MAATDDGDDLLPRRAYAPRGTDEERKGRQANVHRMMLDYIESDRESTTRIERDENTDKITVIRPHDHMEKRVIRAALIAGFMALSRSERDVWLAVEFGVVRDRGADGQWSRRWLNPGRAGGLTEEEICEYYHLSPSTVRQYYRTASQKMRAAAAAVHL